MPLEDWDAQRIWVANGYDAMDPKSASFLIEGAKDIWLHLQGYKISRGFLKGSKWACSISYKLDDKEAFWGWFSANNIPESYEKFDKFKDENLQLSGRIEDALM